MWGLKGHEGGKDAASYLRKRGGFSHRRYPGYAKSKRKLQFNGSPFRHKN